MLKSKSEVPDTESPRNDDPSLWEPVHAEPADTKIEALELLLNKDAEQIR